MFAVTGRARLLSQIAVRSISFAFGVILVWAFLAAGFVGYEKTLDRSGMRAEQGHAVVLHLQAVRHLYDFLDDKKDPQNISVLSEDGRRIGPAHALHEDIRRLGTGRYSIWRPFLYFSTSDNSDPRTNGRTYSIIGAVVPAGPALALLLIVLALGAVTVTMMRRAHAVVPDWRLRGVNLLALLLGMITAALPVIGKLRILGTPLDGIPLLALVTGLTLLVLPLTRLNPQAAAEGETGGLARNTIGVIGIGAMLLLALVSTGAFFVRHSFDMSGVGNLRGKVYEYAVGAMPMFTVIVRDEERTLTHRPLVYDSAGPLVPGQNETRIEAMDGGLSTAWSRTVRFSFRNPGGPEAAANALSLTATLRSAWWPSVAMLAILLMAAGVRGRWLAREGAARAAVPARPVFTPWALAGGAVAILALAAIATGIWRFGAATSQISLAPGLRLTHLFTFLCGVLVLACIPWLRSEDPRTAVPGPVAVTLVLAAAFVAPFVGLADAMIASGRINSVSQTALHLLGMMQASDSFGYLQGAVGLLASGELNSWNSRRPLTAVFTTLRVLAGTPDMATIMLLGALLGAVGLTLATREVLKALGTWPALAFVVACGAFVSEWTPTTLSESTGFAVGAFALAAIFAALRRESALLFALGIAVLSTGLMARAGPFFALPLVVLAGAAAQWRRGKSPVAIWFVAGLAGLAVGLGHSGYLVKMLNGSIDMVQSNFSYTLYGLAVGGKGWQQIYVDHPELFKSAATVAAEPRIYALAIEKLRSEPSLFVKAIFGELGRVPAFFSVYFDPGLINLWMIVGSCLSFLLFRNRVALVVAAAALGLALSSPFIMSDGGPRVYAAAVPLMGLAAAIGFAAFRDSVLMLSAGERLPVIWHVISRLGVVPATSTGRPAVVSAAAFGALALLALIVAAPFIIAPGKLKPQGRLETALTCPDGERRMLLYARHHTRLFDVRPDQETGTLWAPRVRYTDLLRAANVIGPVFSQALAKPAVPYSLRTMAHIDNPDAPQHGYPTLFAFPSAMALPEKSAYVAVCAVRIGEGDSDSIGGVEVFDVRKVAPAALR